MEKHSSCAFYIVIALRYFLEDIKELMKRYQDIKTSRYTKYQDLIKKREKIGLEQCKNPKALIKISNNMQDVYKNIEEHNPDKECKVLIVFDDMIADMLNNKKLHE